MRSSAGKPIAGLGVLAMAAIALGTATIAATGLWYWQFRQTSSLREELAATKVQMQALQSRLDAAEAPATEAPTPAVETSQPPAASEEPTEPPATTSKAVKQFGFMSDVRKSGSTYSLVLDYAQILTGKAAAAAAAARGDESPPPNDYYIVNDNPKLRTFPVASGAKVVLFYNGVAERKLVTMAEFAAIFSANTDGKADSPYYVWVKNGVVTAAEEQYLP